MTPFFSIVVPVYNTENFLDDCIESVLRQSYTNWELILVDDGSTDNSGVICDNFAKKNSKILVFHQENKGQFSARNFGIKESNGTHLIFLDSDDFLESNALHVISSSLRNNDFDVVMYDSYHFVNGKQELSEDNIDFIESCFEHRDIVKFCFLKRTSRISMCAYCFKKALFENTTSIDSQLQTSRSQEDFLMVYSLIEKANSLLIVNELLYNYRMNPNSTSHNTNASSFYDGLSISSRIYQDIVHKYNFDITKDFDSYIKRRLSWLPLSYLLRCAIIYAPKKLCTEYKKVRKDFLYKFFTKKYNFRKAYTIFFLLLKLHLFRLAKKVALKVSK